MIEIGCKYIEEIIRIREYVQRAFAEKRNLESEGLKIETPSLNNHVCYICGDEFKEPYLIFSDNDEKVYIHFKCAGIPIDECYNHDN